MKKVFKTRKLNEITQEEREVKGLSPRIWGDEEESAKEMKRGTRSPEEVHWGLKSLLAAQTTISKFQKLKAEGQDK